MSASTAPTTMRLNNGVDMPSLGLGVYRAPPEQTASAVRTALAAGYRLVDTAAAYQNERAVGEGLRTADVNRDDCFVITKLWVSQYGYESALRAFDASLRRLGLDYVDLYLLHWPVPSAFDLTQASYRAAEQLLADGRVRSIGVCNFEPIHLHRLMAASHIVPAVNQVELHPFFTQRAIRATNQHYGIVTQAWSPIGGVFERNEHAPRPLGLRGPLDHPVIQDLAGKYNKSPAQVVLRWHLHHGVAVIPKSVQAHRMRENIDIFDFDLAPDDAGRIDALHIGARAGADPTTLAIESFHVDIENQ